MTFDEFLSRRIAELLRFAFVICGNREAAESLAEQAALRTFADLGDQVDDPETWVDAARLWTVRAFLSEGMQLGAPVDPDVDAEVEPAQDASGLVDNFARSSKLQRTVLVLHYREHFSETEVANLVGSTAEGIASYIGAILERLDVSAAGRLRSYTEQDLRRELHVLGTDLTSSVELCARIVAALPRPEPTEAEIAAAEVATVEAAAAAAAMAAELAAAEAAQADALEALVIRIAAGTASEVATHVATEAASSVATTAAAETTDAARAVSADVAGQVATETASNVARETATDVATSVATATATEVAGAVAATTATDVATNTAAGVAHDVAAETATGIATEVATTTATEVATGVANDTATATASEVAATTATGVAAEIAAGVAKDAATATSTEIATTTATEVATGVAKDTATATATEVATETASAVARDVAAETATGVATEVATETAAGVARDVATATAGEVANTTATEIATTTATEIATGVAKDTATATATEIATETASGVARDVSAETATGVATEVATDIATATAGDVATATASEVAATTATGVATEVAGGVARDTATATATEIATETASAVARDVSAETATGVATEVATDIATATAGDVATATASEVAATTATGVATEVAAGVARDTATATATQIATETASAVARDVAAETATGIATATATDVARGVAAETSTSIATEVATTTATEVAGGVARDTATTTATEIATETAAGVARDVATETASGVARDVAAETATNVATTTATGVATEVATATAGEVARTTAADVATDTASGVATDVATDVSTTVSNEIAQSVATEIATRIATDVAAQVAAKAIALTVVSAVAEALDDALDAAIDAGPAESTSELPIDDPAADEPSDADEPVAVHEPSDADEPVAADEPSDDPVAVHEPSDADEPVAVHEPSDAADEPEATEPVEVYTPVLITEKLAAWAPVMITETVSDLDLHSADLVSIEDDTDDQHEPVLVDPPALVEPVETVIDAVADSVEDEASVDTPVDSVGTVDDTDDAVEVLGTKEPTFDVQITQPPPYPSQKIVRPLIVLTAVLGLNYLIWRWTFSVNWAVWWISVPLVIAETYSLIDSLLFGFTMWRLHRRPDPGLPPEGATVDVFITTYNEPLQLIMKTAHAAQRITYPHTLWILDDGNRVELKELAESEGIGVISRSSDWIDMPRHAKAGNLNNALMVTQGEFVVILDADQVPAPELLDHTLGYFNDEKMAIVQTPQFFVNVPKSDPLGSQAPLFYGPIQQGKDGWNSAFFCGSNAILRREALLQMGVRRYVLELELRIQDALGTAEKVIRKARSGLPAGQEKVGDALTTVLQAAQEVRDELDAGMSIADATARFQNLVKKASREVVETDLAASQADLAELFDLIGDEYVESPATALNAEALERLTRRDWSPLGAIETVRALIAAVDVDREDEAQPIMPMSTISVTEDMATCMRIHSMGWKSAYHDEILAVGLAPEDLGTMLTQRLRWAQGTVQVMLRENPLRQKGLSLAQRLMYLGTMWSYLSGFAALPYIAAPVIFLVFGILPVDALTAQFFARLIPFLVINQLLFFVIGRGRATWRGQQYSLALFPVWIKAVTSAVGNVAFGRSLSFAVTPKTRVKLDRRPWGLVRPQLFAMGLLFVAGVIGIVRYSVGQAAGLGTILNVVWVVFDLALFSAIPRALFYKGFEPESEEPPAPAEPATSPTVTLQEISG